MFMDFRDLNKTSPKDDFLLAYTDILVDNITAMLSLPLWMGIVVITKLIWQWKT